MFQRMQEFHSMGGGAGRLFGGGVSGDRRMRAYHQSHHHHQALKCPRCDSLHTKFCYYNNYNLSQPRHFCKSCRRYWTKGGVLRNVPVGGGCRKAKRAKSKQSNPNSAADETPVTAISSRNEDGEGNSSESSSLTISNSANATATAAAANSTGRASASVAEVVSAPFPSFFNGVSNCSTKLYGNGVEWSTFLGQGSSDRGIFPEMGSLTSMIATSSDQTTAFGFGGNTLHPQCIDQWENNSGGGEYRSSKLEGVTGGLFEDQTVQGELRDRSSLVPNGGFGPLDWAGGGGEQVMFDLTTVDPAYWSQSQWTTDYLP